VSRQKVDAAIVGAQKSGTTWLAESLSKHPEICLALGKEAHLFDQAEVQKEGVNPVLFSEKFPKPNDVQKLLDATPSYMYLPGCLEALKRNNPDVKVVAILRDPGQRAISHFYHSKKLGHENRSLVVALLQERKKLKKEMSESLRVNSSWRNHSYVDRGRYLHQMQVLLSLFPDALVIPFEYLATKPQDVLNYTQDFLGLRKIELPTLPPTNANFGRRKHRVVSKLIRLYTRSDTRETKKLLQWESAS
jgi:hypothetical protein